MNFNIVKDKVKIENANIMASGSVNYYEATVAFDETWEGLTAYAVLVPRKNNRTDMQGTSVSVINNRIYVDKDISGVYSIGFVGYRTENNEKVYQISTNLVNISFVKGAGEIETEEEKLPTPSQWEVYLSQMQAITNQISGLGDDLQAQVDEVERKLENGDFDGEDGITPTIGQNGNWFLGETDTGKPSRGERGSDGVNGTNGFSPIANVTQTQNGAIISITDKDGTTTVNISNGTDGRDGIDGRNGINGNDGFSPEASVNQTSSGATISITDKNGTTIANISNGINGKDGVGVPTGGTAGQVLSKIDGTDYNTEWITPSGGESNEIGIHTKPYSSGSNTFVTHSYFFANSNSNAGQFEESIVRDMLEKAFNDAITHYDDSVTENIIILKYLNDSSDNTLVIRISGNTFTGTKYGKYYQYAPENIFYSQVQFTSRLVNDTYSISNLQYRGSQRFLIALGTNNTRSYTPVSDYNPATKKYVDDIVGNIETLLGGI